MGIKENKLVREVKPCNPLGAELTNRTNKKSNDYMIGALIQLG